MKITNKLNQAGDTIIEVLIAVAILALVLAVSYGSTNRSLENGVDSSNRQQAISIASQQIEIIKAAQASSVSNAAMTQYTTNPGTPFCITSSGLTSSPYGYTTNTSTCNNFNSTVFNLADTYSVSGVFTITASWPSSVSDNNGISKITLYYR